MSKKRIVGNPWHAPTQALPNGGERVLVKYASADNKEFMCIGWLDPASGWMLHDSMRLPEKWRILYWMEIIEPRRSDGQAIH